jgi:hypothetical protein
MRFPPLKLLPRLISTLEKETPPTTKLDLIQWFHKPLIESKIATLKESLEIGSITYERYDELIQHINNVACFYEKVMEYKPLLNSKIQSKEAFLKESLEDGSLTQEQYNKEIQPINNFTSEIGTLVDFLSDGIGVGTGIDIGQENPISTIDTELWLGRIKQFLES